MSGRRVDAPSSGPFSARFLFLLPFEGVPGSLAPGLANPGVGREEDFSNFVPKEYPFCPMSESPRKDTKVQLAIALAQGISAGKWARANEVPRNRAYRWAKDPSVRKAAESYRRRTIDQAVGKMTKHTNRAVDIIFTIANEAESDSVRLRAARAIFSDMMAVSEHSGLEVRMTEIEEKLLERAGGASSNIATWAAPSYGQGATPAAMPPVTSIGTGAG